MQAPQYQAWCTNTAATNDSSSYEDVDNTPFWTNPKCQQLYKDHVKVVLTRCGPCSLKPLGYNINDNSAMCRL